MVPAIRLYKPKFETPKICNKSRVDINVVIATIPIFTYNAKVLYTILFTCFMQKN